ncbi:hypothetical protein [Lacihabitans lacunae]|uniref:Replication endonuclease n=1 Tax=Lacihabitans lacunae TaxID=1028214 RepID=A0ABV7YUL4_9BACT
MLNDGTEQNKIIHCATIERKMVIKTNSILIYDAHKREMMVALNPRAKENLNNQNGNDSSMNGYLSHASRRHIERTLAVWLTAIELKNILSLQKKEVNAEKVFPTFVTLTLPSTQMHGDNQIKAKILNPFIKWITENSKDVYTKGSKKGKQKGFGVKCFFWRAEPQKNTRIHFHIIADKYVPWERIREEWNRCCEILGYVSRYSKVQKARFKNGFEINQNQLKEDKFNIILISQEHLKKSKYLSKEIRNLMEKYKGYNFSFNEKLNMKEVEKVLIEKQKVTYQKAYDTGFTNPPSTEIRAIQNLKSLTAYVIKYIAKKPTEMDLEPNQRVVYNEIEKKDMLQTFEIIKDPDTNEKKEVIIDEVKYVPKFEERKISGRIWGCSDNLKGFKITDDLIIEEDEIGRKFLTGKKIKVMKDGIEIETEEKHQKIPITEMRFFTKTVSKREVMADNSHHFPKYHVSDEFEVNEAVKSFIEKMITTIGQTAIDEITSKAGKGFENINGLIIPIIPEKMGYKSKNKEKKVSVRIDQVLKDYGIDQYESYILYYEHVFKSVYQNK